MRRIILTTVSGYSKVAPKIIRVSFIFCMVSSFDILGLKFEVYLKAPDSASQPRTFMFPKVIKLGLFTIGQPGS